jgi:hypothetical protein
MEKKKIEKKLKTKNIFSDYFFQKEIKIPFSFFFRKQIVINTS